MMKVKHTVWAVVVMGIFSVSALADDSIPTFFPHATHKEERGCLDCHAMIKKPSEPSMPEAGACKDCHDDSPRNRMTLRRQKNKPSPVIFSHTAHSQTGCDTCHEIRENQAPVIPNAAMCIRCHTTMEVKTTCGDCHAKPFTPEYHTQAWLKTHGAKSKNHNNLIHGRDCSQCHPSPACTRCHQTTKPKNHTGFFRLRGHGLKASIEARSCQTCHRESFCIQCHRETKPMNHHGAWRYSHGFAVSGGLSGSRGKCSVCHNHAWCASCHN